jgi:4-diphosphocytidyl-2-C-methyl-D-erythritol kinase
MIIEAPCKINLHLAVGAKRPDGFHDITSVFLSLNLCDTLEIELKAPSLSFVESVEIETDASELPAELAAPLEALPPKQNIIYKAAKLFWKTCGALDGSARPVKITVKKRIPTGAGLGGASSDAAATLLALNTLTGGPLSTAVLRDAAAELGSDVPFFLDGGGAAFVEGRGEKIRALPTPKLFVVLLNPLFASATARAFKLLDDFRASTQRLDADSFKEENRSKTLSPDPRSPVPRSWLNFSGFQNDFLPALDALGTDAEKAAYRAMLADLKAAGAEFASLSGSGSTCFGVFARESDAKAAALTLGEKWCWVTSVSPRLDCPHDLPHADSRILADKSLI